jgi:hypothetical protein
MKRTSLRLSVHLHVLRSHATVSRALITAPPSGTWFRVLTKKLLSEEPKASGEKDYRWYEMGFFARWSGAGACRILCVDTPREVREQLNALLVAAPTLELRDPFAMLRLLLDEVIKCCNDNTWRMTNQVREVEKV